MGECAFSDDCLKVKRCDEMTTRCVCLFEKCVPAGDDPFDEHPDECDTYKDCECKSDPKNCFCHDHMCLNEAWECHQDPAKKRTYGQYSESPVECAALEKCKGKKCVCDFLNTCEHVGEEENKVGEEENNGGEEEKYGDEIIKYVGEEENNVDKKEKYRDEKEKYD